MGKSATTVAACVAVITFMLPSELASAAITKSAYAKKWAECKEQAKSRHHGIHWVKRNQWIRNCITDAKNKRF